MGGDEDPLEARLRSIGETAPSYAAELLAMRSPAPVDGVIADLIRRFVDRIPPGSEEPIYEYVPVDRSYSHRPGLLRRRIAVRQEGWDLAQVESGWFVPAGSRTVSVSTGRESSVDCPGGIAITVDCKLLLAWRNDVSGGTVLLNDTRGRENWLGVPIGATMPEALLSGLQVADSSLPGARFDLQYLPGGGTIERLRGRATSLVPEWLTELLARKLLSAGVTPASS